MAEYRIMAAGPEHVAALAGVERAAATVFPPGSIPDELRDDAMPPEILREARLAGHLWVAVPRGDGARAGADGALGPQAAAPVGFGVLRLHEGLALLAELDVMPEHAGKGLGRALIARVAAAAASEGFDGLYLTTFTHVPWNAPFYARLGFRMLAEGELPQAMRRILADERAYGLPNRAAMRLELPPKNIELTDKLKW